MLDLVLRFALIGMFRVSEALIDIVICISTFYTEIRWLNFKICNFYFLETYFEIELVKKLEIKIEKQRNEIKKLEQSTIDYKTENEEVSNIFRIFRWSTTNKTLIFELSLPTPFHCDYSYGAKKKKSQLVAATSGVSCGIPRASWIF